MNKQALRAMGIIPPKALRQSKKEEPVLQMVPDPKNDGEAGNNNNEKEEKKFDSDSVGTNLSQEKEQMTDQAMAKKADNSTPEPAKVEVNLPQSAKPRAGQDDQQRFENEIMLGKLDLDRRRFENEVRRIMWETEDRSFMNRHVIPAAKFCSGLIAVACVHLGYSALSNSDS